MVMIGYVRCAVHKILRNLKLMQSTCLDSQMSSFLDTCLNMILACLCFINPPHPHPLDVVRYGMEKKERIKLGYVAD